MPPVLKEVVFIGEPIADVELKVVDDNLSRVIGKTACAGLVEAIILAMDMKLVEVVIIPVLGDLE